MDHYLFWFSRNNNKSSNRQNINSLKDNNLKPLFGWSEFYNINLTTI